jgi:hypothetical protein
MPFQRGNQNIGVQKVERSHGLVVQRGHLFGQCVFRCLQIGLLPACTGEGTLPQVVELFLWIPPFQCITRDRAVSSPIS